MKVLRFSGSPSVRDALGRDDGALDDQQVDARRDQRRRQRLRVLRADPHGGGHPGVADPRDRGAEQFGIQRRGMQLLQQPDRRRRFGLLLGGLDDLGDLGLDVGVPADQPLAVEHAEPAEAAQLDGELRRHQRVGRVRDHRDLEPVGVELPRRRHVLRRPGAPRRHDVDVVEFVGAAGGSAHADFNHVAHAVISSSRERSSRARSLSGRSSSALRRSS